MLEPVNIPLFSSFGSRFHYGSTIVVEFDPDSPWYETSLTIAASAINEGITTDYHTFHHPPDEIPEAITKLCVNIQKAVSKGRFRILDSYSVQLGEKKPSKQDGRVTVSKIEELEQGLAGWLKVGQA